MQRALIIRRALGRTYVAVSEDGRLAELAIEENNTPGQVGTVYAGKVVRVLAGMQAAFVDIGLDRAAFLYADDVLSGQFGDQREARLPPEATPRAGAAAQGKFRRSAQQPIQSLVRSGQTLLVQVRKEAMGTKGARVTNRINLTGRLLVYLPHSDQVALSQRLSEPAERMRLVALLEPWTTAHGGLIVRTAARGHSGETLLAEAELLRTRWHDIKRSFDQGGRPRQLWRDSAQVPALVRQLYSGEMQKVWVDDAPLAQQLSDYVAEVEPSRVGSVYTYEPLPPGVGADEPLDIFAAKGMAKDVAQALKPRVELPCGGHLVIEACEALTVIDVNSGRFVGAVSAEQTLLALNLEAAHEVAKQLRLRNVGGIVAIDFVDLAEPGARHLVVETLRQALRETRQNCVVLPMSELGVVQLTRKRTRPSLQEQLTEPCPTCSGKGRISHGLEIVRAVLLAARQSLRQRPCDQILLNVAPSIAERLWGCDQAAVAELEAQASTSLVAVAQLGRHPERFEVLNGNLAGWVADYDLR